LSKKTRMMGAEPGRPNELSPITRIDTARVRPVQSAAGRSFIEPGSPWQNPFVESFGSRVRDEVLSVEAFDSVLEAQTVITDWRKRCSLLARKVSSKRGNFREHSFPRTPVNKRKKEGRDSDAPARLEDCPVPAR
jgi:hypothetical protein